MEIPPLKHPKLLEIENALTLFDPALVEFGRKHGFVLSRGGHGGAHMPRRGLRRILPDFTQGIGLVMACDIRERLERGFYPDLPCRLYINACTLGAEPSPRRWLHHMVVESQPWSEFEADLLKHLTTAARMLELHTRDYVIEHGECEQFSR